MTDIIFHHYEMSPFSELVRIGFGLKGLAWKSVQIPNIAPKPDLIPLTGGYRKTPVMQIGANIYCDTAACIEALETHHPAPSFYPAPMGRAAAFLAMWSAGPMFSPAVAAAMAPSADMLPQEFWDDRKALFGMDKDRFLPLAPHLTTQFQASLARLEDALSDGRPFVGGDAAGYADLALYMNIWFQRRFNPDPAVLKPFQIVHKWEVRIASIGHGDRTEIEAVEALDVAKAAEPVVDHDVDTISGFADGQAVTVRTEDPGANPVAGQLARLTHKDIVVLRDDPRVGRVAVHFPRLGQIVMAA